MDAAAKKFSELVRAARQAKDVSLRTAAGDLGIAPSYLSDIENDRRIPSDELIRKMAEYFTVDYEELWQSAGKYGQEIEEVLKTKNNPQHTYQMFRILKDSRAQVDEQFVEGFKKLVKDQEAKSDGQDH
jgi:transcriptional regulator with XRE-family HTH domain